ncbi:MAG: hypothetical protein ACI837_001208 [Crocinitomicaceae bacterium]|jgi:hypothetical protein
MKNAVYILLIAFIFLGCSFKDRRNTLLNVSTNIARNDKAIVFYKDGLVSVNSYNVSIVEEDYSLVNNVPANVFSYSKSDSCKIDKSTYVEVVWVHPTELLIKHPEDGTLWKNDSTIKVNGTRYTIRYQTKKSCF